MKRIVCEMCGSNDLLKQDDRYICQSCGTSYTTEEARKLLIEISGPVDVSGSTVKVDNSAFVEKYLANARRAYNKEDWEEVEKYYNMVEQNVPNNMEAVFFSAFGKTMLSFTDNNYFKRQQQFHVLNNSISVINDYFEVTTENREEVLRKIASAIIKMDHITFVYDLNQLSSNIGSLKWQKNLINTTKRAFITELDQIAAIHDDSYIKELKETIENQLSSGGCYVATCVYGSYDCPQVWTLRRYRDNTLAETWYGRAFIHIYYKVSPTIVKLFGKTKWFKALWKNKLDKMVDKLKLNGVEDTPYEDKEW